MSKQQAMNDEKKVIALLKSERDGGHGMSERRVAAEFVMDAMEGNEPDEDGVFEQAAGLAESLAGFCTELAKSIRKLKPKK